MAPHLSHFPGLLVTLGIESESPSEFFMLLGSGGEGRTQVPDLVFHVRGIFYGVRDFIAQQTPVTLPHRVQLFFHGSLGHAQSRGKIGVGHFIAFLREVAA
jgi:hypothetical protein